MAMQFFRAIEFPRTSIGRTLPVTAYETDAIRVASPAWPPDGGVQRQPSVSASWKIQDDRLTLVWA
jgi:hypothetical protein